MPVPLHTTGKASFDHIYDRPDPRAYYRRMAELGYSIPDSAAPFFQQQLREYRASARVAVPTVLDIGCSYGVNAALLRFGTSVAELAESYAGTTDRDSALALDKGRAEVPNVAARFLGIDASRPALEYAAEAGLLDEVVHADLESADPDSDQREVLARADLVISTGCIGYVTEKTLVRVATAHPRRRPWMAHFVLRMFDYGPVAAELAALGYRTEQVPGLHAQRRFASADEQAQVLKTLADKGIDTTGYEAEGSLYATLHLSRPLPEHSADPEDNS
ncbi:class I SAM-dependent methyltransferase [Nocardia harenae]|uniref:class I SAM-dependent methyltransferase n=1 Tax=Nocardia harenae TaxID=358707 RepID=UPI000834086D|nr:class I SAM-dependent methyltransferase [Nocardia harenae]